MQAVMDITQYHKPQEEISEEQLLIAKAKKDSSLFAPLYKKYHEQIFLFALRRVESEDSAADITSQVFLKALMNLSKYKDMGLPFSSWLFRIARNELYDQFSRNKIEMVVSMETKNVLEIISEIGEEAREDDSKLYAAMEELTNDEMELIELRYFDKHHFKKVGEILDITENNAKVKTYRVLDKLKKLYHDGNK